MVIISFFLDFGLELDFLEKCGKSDIDHEVSLYEIGGFLLSDYKFVAAFKRLPIVCYVTRYSNSKEVHLASLHGIPCTIQIKFYFVLHFQRCAIVCFQIVFRLLCMKIESIHYLLRIIRLVWRRETLHLLAELTKHRMSGFAFS